MHKWCLYYEEEEKKKEKKRKKKINLLQFTFVNNIRYKAVLKKKVYIKQ